MRARAAAVLAALLAAASLIVGWGAGPASASSSGPVLFGTVTSNDTGVAGVKITASSDAGFSGEATTDDKGAWEIKTPKSGTYTVVLDEATLPEGVALAPDSGNTRTVNAFLGKVRIQFPTGEGLVETTSKAEQAIQLTVDGLLLGLILALAAVGLSLIYGTTGLTNFAHGEMVTVGALAAYFYSSVLHVPFILAALLALITCGILGAVQDKVLWKQLRKRGTGLIAMLVVSIGLAIFVRYLFLFFFGGGTQQFPEYSAQAGLQLGPLSITPKAIIGALAAIIAILATIYWLLRTRMGKASRAVADNPALASASGIDVERVINTVWILGATLAALAGILVGLTSGVSWNMGQQILLLIFAAVTVGGLGTAFGALLGSLIVGLLIQLSTLVIPPELKSVGALVILIVILLVRPQGLLGRRERIG
ncbi:MAG: branched-chain amino acid ABC transporter permease [Candidatus Nanopelagicales bacterium]